MVTPVDYDDNPERFRLGAKVTAKYLTASQSLYAHIADRLVQSRARLILDVGCGEGAMRAAMPPHLKHHLIGLDSSSTMLRSHPRPVVHADATRLPFATGVFDVVVAVNMLYHLTDPTLAIRQAHRVLVPGGMFVAAAPSRHDSPELAHIWRPPRSSFDAEQAPELIAAVFDHLEAEMWDAQMITLPDVAAVRDYLVARFVPPHQAADAANQIETPLDITKRGVLLYARK